AMKRPISASPLAEIVPTWAISSFEVTFLEFFWRSATMVSALGAKRHAYRVGERIDAVQHFVTRVDGEFHFLGGHLSIPFCSTSSRGATTGRAPTRRIIDPMFARPSKRPASRSPPGREFGERTQAAFFLASASTSTPI